MAKYSYEQKLEAVLGVVEKGLSANAADNIIGACHGDAQKWVKLYKVIKSSVNSINGRHNNAVNRFCIYELLLNQQNSHHTLSTQRRAFQDF